MFLSDIGYVCLIAPYFFSRQLSGIAVLGVGIWVRVDKNVVQMQDLIEFNSDDKSLSTAAFVLIGFGSFVLLVSAFGFLAACCAEKTKFFIIGVSFFYRFHVVLYRERSLVQCILLAILPRKHRFWIWHMPEDGTWCLYNNSILILKDLYAIVFNLVEGCHR